MLDAPVETVWRYLTEADLRRQWFMGGTDAPASARSISSSTTTICRPTRCPIRRSNAAFKGTIWTEKVIRFDPPRLLETTFQGGKNGIVTYELIRGRADAAGADP